MFRTLDVFLCAISRLIGYLPGYGKIEKLINEGKIKEAEEILVKNYIQSAITKLVKKAGMDIDIKGYENVPKEGPFMFISNHQSDFDAIALFYAMKERRFGFVAKKELAKVPVLSKWMKITGTSFIDRKNPRQAIKDIMEAEETVKKGTPLCVFPEGTRSKSSEVGPFKTGVFKILEKTKVPVVPVSIEGTYKVYEANGNKVKPAKVTLTFGEVIETKDFTKDDFREFPEKIKEIIIKNKRDPE